MQVQIFNFSKSYFSHTWKIDQVEVESTISSWLRSHSDIDVKFIKHDAVTSFWYPTQLFVFIYYQ